MVAHRDGERQASPWRPSEEEDSGSFPSAIILFALVGATATTAAVGQLRHTVNWFYTQLSRRSEPFVYWEDMPHRPNLCGEAWERYYERMRKRNEDLRERVECIRAHARCIQGEK